MIINAFNQYLKSLNMALFFEDYSIIDMIYFRHGIIDIGIGLGLLSITNRYDNTIDYLFGENENFEIRRYFGYFMLCIGILRLISIYNKQYVCLTFTYVFEVLVTINEAFIFGTIKGDFVVAFAMVFNLFIAYFTYNKMK